MVMRLSAAVLFVLAVFLAVIAAPVYASGTAEPPTAVDLTQEPAAPDANRAVNSESQRYAFNIKAANVRLQLRVNDVPVMFKIFRNPESLDISFNEWMKRGLNKLEVQMERFSEQQPYEVSYSVYFQSPTQVVSGERRVLFSTPDQVSLPHRQPIGIRAPSVPVMRIWQTEKVHFTVEERDRLIDSLNSLRARLIDALRKGDNAFLATFDKPIRDEIEKAYGRIPAGEQETMKRRLDIADRLRKMVNAQAEASPELKIDDLNFDVIAEGTLVRVTRIDGDPVIKVSRGDLTYSVARPIYGTVGGLWDIMRSD